MIIFWNMVFYILRKFSENIDYEILPIFFAFTIPLLEKKILELYEDFISKLENLNENLYKLSNSQVYNLIANFYTCYNLTVKISQTFEINTKKFKFISSIK